MTKMTSIFIAEDQDDLSLLQFLLPPVSFSTHSHMVVPLVCNMLWMQQPDESEMVPLAASMRSDLASAVQTQLSCSQNCRQ